MADATNDEDEVVEEAEGAGLTEGQVVAMKSADVHTASSGEHLKVFTYPPGPKPTEANGVDHEANKATAVQYMLSQGMRPTGEARVKSIKQHPNGISWNVTIAVPARPTSEVEGPSEPNIVLGDDGEAPANTEGPGHSDDTRPDGDTP